MAAIDVSQFITDYNNPKSIDVWAKQIDADIKDDINSLRLVFQILEKTPLTGTPPTFTFTKTTGTITVPILIPTELDALKKSIKDYIILVTKLKEYFTSKNLTIDEKSITEQLTKIAKTPPPSPPNYSVTDFEINKLDIVPTIGPIDTSKPEGIDKLIKDLKKLLIDPTQTPVLNDTVIDNKISDLLKKPIIEKLEELKTKANDAVIPAGTGTGTPTDSNTKPTNTEINKVNELIKLINGLKELHTNIEDSANANANNNIGSPLNKDVIDAHIAQVNALPLPKKIDDTKDLQIQLLILLKEFLTKNPTLKLTTPEAINAAIQAFVDKLPKSLSSEQDNSNILNSILSNLQLSPAEKHKFEKRIVTPKSLDDEMVEGLKTFFGEENSHIELYQKKNEAPYAYVHVKDYLKDIRDDRRQLEKVQLSPMQQLLQMLLRVPVDSSKKLLERMSAMVKDEETIRGVGEIIKKGGGRRHKRMRGGAPASENAAQFLIKYIEANKGTPAAPAAAVDEGTVAGLINVPTATPNALDKAIDARIDAKITVLKTEIDGKGYALKTELDTLKTEIIGAINVATTAFPPASAPTPATATATATPIKTALESLLGKVKAAIDAAAKTPVAPAVDTGALEARLIAAQERLATKEELDAAERRLAAAQGKALEAAERRLAAAQAENAEALTAAQAENARALATAQAALEAAKTELGEANAAAASRGELATVQAEAQRQLAAAARDAAAAQAENAAAQQAAQAAQEKTIAAIQEQLETLKAAATPTALPSDLASSLETIYAKVATVTKIQTELLELTRRVDLLQEEMHNITDIKAQLAQLIYIIPAATAGGAGMRGGVEKVELPKDPLLILKEKKGHMEEYKKEIRQLIANADGYRTRILEQFVKNIKESLPKESDNLLTTSKIDLLILKLETLGKSVAPPTTPPTTLNEIPLSDLTAIYNAEPVTTYSDPITVDKAKTYIGDLKAKRSDIANVEKKMLGTYDYLDKEGKNFKETIQKSITEDRKNLKDVTDKVIALMEEEPQLNRTWANKMIGLIKQRLTGIDPVSNDEKPEEGLDTMYTTLVNSLKTIYEDAYTKIKPIAEGIIREQKQAVELAKAQSTKLVRGGRSSHKRRYYGGATTVDNEAIKLTNVLADTPSTPNIKNNLNSILNDVFNDIYKQYTRRMNPTMMAANAASPPTLYQMIYRKYTDRAPDDPYGAAEELSQGLKINNLVPKEALEITRNDRIVFMFVTLFLRLFAINITNWTIDKGYFVTLQSAFIMYLVAYSILFLFFVGIVNFDMYRMRIVFNYVNLHANRPRIMSHLFAFWVFAFFIYLYFNAINSLSIVDSKNIAQKPSSLGDEDKARLQYKVQMLTIILWLLLIVMIILL